MKSFISFLFQDSVNSGLRPEVLSLLKVPLCPKSYKVLIYYRLLQYYLQKSYSGGVFYIIKMRYRHLCGSMNVTLYPETNIGKGLCFPHGFPVVVNPAATIGKNCIIHPCVLIGRDRGKSGAPQIGDNCFIGHGSKIIGNPKIGDWCFIAPGAIITKDIPSESVVGSGLNNILSSDGKRHVKLYLK